MRNIAPGAWRALIDELRALSRRIKALEQPKPLEPPTDDAPSPLSGVPGGGGGGGYQKHAYRHADGGGTHPIGDDRLGPFKFTWQHEHTWKPSSTSYTPLKLVDSSSNVMFELLNGGKVSIQDPTADNAWLNIQNPDIGEDVVLALGPKAWFDGSDTQNGGTEPTDYDEMSVDFTSWKDKSGNAYDQGSSSSTGQNPLYCSTTTGGDDSPPSLPNSKPVMSFRKSGSNRLVSTSEFSGGPITASNFTVYAVTMLVATGNQGTIVGDVNNTDIFDGPSALKEQTHDGAQPAQVYTDGEGGAANYTVNYNGVDTGYGTNSWARSKWKRDGTTHTHKIDNTDISINNQSGSGGAADPIKFGQLGQRTKWPGSSDAVYNGWIAEVIIFDYALSASQESLVEAYLDNKYALNGGGGGGTGTGADYLEFTDPGDSVKFKVDQIGRTHIGGDDPASMLQVSYTNEQLRLNFDGSNYTSFTVDSAGDLTVAPTGDMTLTPGGGDFTLTGDVALTGDLTVTGEGSFTSTTKPQLRLQYDSNSYLDFEVNDAYTILAFTNSASQGDDTRLIAYNRLWVRADGGVGHGGTVQTHSDDLVIQSSSASDVGITLACGGAAVGRLVFADQSDDDVGQFAYAHTNDTYYINAGGSQIMTWNTGTIDIDASDLLLSNGDLYFSDKTTGSRIYTSGSNLVITPDIDSNSGYLDIQGRTFITNDRANQNALRITGASGQTAHYINLQQDGGTQVFAISAGGIFYGPVDTEPFKWLSQTDDVDALNKRGAYYFGQAIGGTASDHHTSWADNSSNVILKLNLDGRLYKNDDSSDEFMSENGTHTLTGSFTWADNNPIKIGSAGDIEVDFDATNLIIDLGAVTTGVRADFYGGTYAIGLDPNSSLGPAVLFGTEAGVGTPTYFYIGARGGRNEWVNSSSRDFVVKDSALGDAFKVNNQGTATFYGNVPAGADTSMQVYDGYQLWFNRAGANYFSCKSVGGYFIWRVNDDVTGMYLSTGGNLHLTIDNAHHYFGADDDASIRFTGTTDFVFNTATGTGMSLRINEVEKFRIGAADIDCEVQFRIDDNQIRWKESSAPSTPASTYAQQYLDSTSGELTALKDDGEKHNLERAHFVISSYIDKKERQGTDFPQGGGFEALTTGAALDSVPTNINVTNGTSKIMVVVNAGSDTSGSITVTGTSVDRDTGNETGSDTDTLTISGTTTDSSDTDADSNNRWSFTNAYITSKWFTGAVTLSTTDLTLTDVDVYSIAFEQYNDNPDTKLETMDITAFATNTSAWLYVYMYKIAVSGDTCSITRQTSFDVAWPASKVAAANRHFRFRRSPATPLSVDGSTDGAWVELHLGPSANAYWEDIDFKLWGSKPYKD